MNRSVVTRTFISWATLSRNTLICQTESGGSSSSQLGLRNTDFKLYSEFITFRWTTSYLHLPHNLGVRSQSPSRSLFMDWGGPKSLRNFTRGFMWWFIEPCVRPNHFDAKARVRYPTYFLSKPTDHLHLLFSKGINSTKTTRRYIGLTSMKNEGNWHQPISDLPC